MKIDAFAHVLPLQYFERVLRALRDGDDPARADFFVTTLTDNPAMCDMAARWPQMDEIGEDYRQILVLASPGVESLGPPEVSAELARLANDEMAVLVAEHPERFVGFAAGIPMNDIELALAEIDYAVGRHGALGIQLYSNILGRSLDDPEFEPVLARLAELDRAIWIHPLRSVHAADYVDEPISRYNLFGSLGWPYDTSVAMARLVYSGTMERYPELKIITHHGGGIVAQCAGRLKEVETVGPESDVVASRLRLPVLEYFKRFYCDTAMFGNAVGLRASIDFFGADHVLFGTDFGFRRRYAPEAVADIESLELSAAERDQIYSGNARRILAIS
jgi:predicted TIM-barrel fold metal-dependent hydrolase